MAASGTALRASNGQKDAVKKNPGPRGRLGIRHSWVANSRADLGMSITQYQGRGGMVGGAA